MSPGEVLDGHQLPKDFAVDDSPPGGHFQKMALGRSAVGWPAVAERRRAELSVKGFGDAGVFGNDYDKMNSK